MMIENYKIIDISQPVSSRTACFPGDVPFSRDITATFKDSGVINLTAITMSPHVGTHTDAPIHIYGDMADGKDMAASLPLEHFLGDACVFDISPFAAAIEPHHIEDKAWVKAELPPRVLFKTTGETRYEVFEDNYAYLSPDLVDYLAGKGVVLIGIDAPSVDRVHSKKLEAHHALVSHRMSWLENLDLTRASEGRYILIALPLKLEEVEASPVRAILLSENA